ncbi:MAG: GH25 family lysozyme [Nannocystaceae bacterium]
MEWISVRYLVAVDLLVLLAVAAPADVARAGASARTAPTPPDPADLAAEHGAVMGHGAPSLGLSARPSAPEPASVCADGPTVPGIDVSAWQGVIDWQAVADSGVRFAVIRISDGTQYLDKYFDANWAEAQAAGLIVSAYQFFRPGQDAIAQAQLFLDTMGPLGPGILVPVLDVEDNDDLPPDAVAAQVAAWMYYVEAAIGARPMIYTGKYFWNDKAGGDTSFSEYPLWIAQWGPVCPDLPNAWSDWLFHQTSATGSIPGISGNVDTDLFNGDEAALQELADPAPPVCGDGKCSGGDEVEDTCPVDCPPCGMIPEEGGVIDDVDACFRHEGDPESWYIAERGYGGSLTWTHAITGEVDHIGTWSLYFEAAGLYRVEAHVDPDYATSAAATYRIFGASGEIPVTMDLASADADGWLDLGTFDFQAAGHGQLIHLDDVTGEPSSALKRLAFDAIRVTPPGAATTGDDTEGSTSSSTSTGDDTSGSGSGTGTAGSTSTTGSADDPTGLGDPAASAGEGDPDADDGCGCASDRRSGPSGALVGLLGALVFACGRRRRPASGRRR